MSKIDDLIAKMCPNGVQLVSITETAEYVRGLTYSKDKENLQGTIKVLRSNNINQKQNVLEFSDVKILDGSVKVRPHQKLNKNDILMSAASGSRSHVGKVAFIWEDIDYYFGGFMAVWRTKDFMHPQFLFHILTSYSFSEYLDSAISSTTINNLSESILKDFLVPLPPLEVQKEIVAILDKFTDLEAELEAELDAELEARKKQFEYYRQELLTFDANEVPYSILEDVYEFQYGKGNTIPTTGGKYPVFGSNGVVGSHNEFNNEDAPVIGHIGAYAGIVNWAHGKHFVTYNGVICKIKDGFDPRFGYHLLMKQNLRELAHEGSQPFVSYDKLKSVIVQLPKHEKQIHLAVLLDKLEALITEISINLPAEIKARRQQYEYYRSKLLTFNELDIA